MATFKLYLDTRSPRKDGSVPVKISVNHKRSFLINIKVHSKPENFVNGEVIIPGDIKRQNIINKYINERLIYVENTLNKLMLLGQLANMSDIELKSMLDTNFVIKENRPPLFKEYFNQYVERKTNKRVKELYRTTERKISQICNIDTLLFSDINIAWLRELEALLIPTCKINTRAIHFRNIRAVFNDAIDEDVIDQNCYPFRKFKIKKEATQKRSLSINDLSTLRDYTCEEYMEKYRDIFMLIFYLVGINTVDLFNLTSIKDGRIEYRRAKTARLYSIKVEPEALVIINKYRGKKYLLDVLDTYSDYRDFAHRLNNNLKNIGPMTIQPRKNGRLGKKEYKGLFPGLSTYWARHTWATIAASLDIPKETIAAALGHGGNTVTDIYINFDQNKVDKANRKVINYVNKIAECK